MQRSGSRYTWAVAAAVGITTVLSLGAAWPDLERYELDPSHTYVGFSVTHLAVSTVKGRFTSFDGHIMVHPEDVTKSSVDVTIEASSLDTSNDRRDEHLRSADFFEVEKYPTLRFVSKRVEETADGLVMVGDLTIRDVTKEVRMPFELRGPVEVGGGQKRLGADGTLTVNRFDYGLEWNRLQEAIAVVGEDVKIELHVEAATPRPR